jgi:hypothetical protein
MAAMMNEPGFVVWVCFPKFDPVHAIDEPRYPNE